MRVPSHGRGKLRNGGTNKGGPGRPPDAFKAMCRDLANSDAVEAKLRAVLNDPDHPAFMSALKWASEHGFGKPTQVLDVQVTDKRAERMAAARARVAG